MADDQGEGSTMAGSVNNGEKDNKGEKFLCILLLPARNLTFGAHESISLKDGACPVRYMHMLWLCALGKLRGVHGYSVGTCHVVKMVQACCKHHMLKQASAYGTCREPHCRTAATLWSTILETSWYKTGLGTKCTPHCPGQLRCPKPG